jgi:hypothetical protein
MLAGALARAGACRQALGATTAWKTLRTQDADAGSRYELGLGADLAPLSAQELSALATAHANRSPGSDPELEALLASMTPRPAADDPDGAWLLESCGLKTVHRVDSATLYVSHLPILGLTITGPPEVAPGGWTEVHAGRFTDGGFSDLLVYEPATGTGGFLSADGRGGLTVLKQQTGWKKTWTAIVTGDFTSSALDDVLFYERSSGRAELHRADGAGNLTLVKSYTGWRQSWSAIVAGAFRAGSGSELFFYDRSAGSGELYALDGDGNLAPLGETDLGRSWTHVIACDFAPGPLSDVLCYDHATGAAEVHATDGRGRLSLVRRLTDWPRGFTHVVAIAGGVLAYDRDAGTAQVRSSDGALESSSADWRTSWTQIVAGRFARGAGNDLLFYERATGTVETRTAGGLALLRSGGGWPKSAAQAYEAHYRAPGDPAGNVVLTVGLAAAASTWGGPAWTVLPGTPWQAAVGPTAGTLDVFRAAGLPAVADPGPVGAQLAQLPSELVTTIQLDAGLAAAIVAGQEAAVERIRALVAHLQANNVVSALPLVTAANQVLVVLGATSLPQAGINLSDRRASGFRWYLVPLQGLGGELSASGSRTEFVPAGPGVSALVVIGYARLGNADPYEYRVDLPPGALLTPLQYEFLMNALDQTFPIGVGVNTYAIRQGHVDVDGDGTATPLTPAVSKTYRTYRRRRHRGQVAVTLDEPLGG